MIERILALLKDKNLTPSQFADEIGIQRSGMSHLISGRNKPSLEFIMKVLNRFPDVKPEYLLFGNMDEGKNKSGVSQGAEQVSPQGQATLFDQPEEAESRLEPRTLRQVRKEKTMRKIERIVVFYDDRTFMSYDPD